MLKKEAYTVTKEKMKSMLKNNDIKKLISSYNRFVPHQLLDLLGKRNILDIELGDQVEKNITVMFSDIRNFTSLSESLSPYENFSFINSYLSHMEPLINSHKGIIDKFIGDSIMAIYPDSANDALDCAVRMIQQLKRYNEGRKRAGYKEIDIGIGLNTGLSMLGTVGGKNRMDSTVISDAVNQASRLESATKTYGAKLLISENTYYNLKNAEQYHIRFVDRILLKGKTRPQSIYEVYDGDDHEIVLLKDKSKHLFEEAMACYQFKDIDQAEQLLNECLAIYSDDVPIQVYQKKCRDYRIKGIHFPVKEVAHSLVWDSDCLIGEEEIDKQHYELFTIATTLINSVKNCCKNRDQQNSIMGVLEFLDSYVHDHFQTEEKLMEEYDYPFLEHQKEQHQRFCLSFERIREEVINCRGSKNYLMFRIQVFVIDWLINHTLKEDKHFGRFLKRAKS